MILCRDVDLSRLTIYHVSQIIASHESSVLQIITSRKNGMKGFARRIRRDKSRLYVMYDINILNQKICRKKLKVI